MASMSSENLEYVIDDIEIETLEVPEVDETLLKALLDESNENEAEDERLGSVIRSLEAEIDPKMIVNHSLTYEPDEMVGIYENYEDNRSDECSVSCHMENFDWVDMEMDCTSSPSDDMGNWYMDTFTDEIGSGIVEFGELKDYSQFYYGVQLEDHAYSSLWQETYDTVMYV
ncbi:hypothetical protein BVC80_8019g2 [Macleaya cordata]|uniref:Uncharacterized protein n=1 Tax=Macleaya cordata TaxID=56857 RepID=A0A200QS23_MACCD|nr:hypothetical protein BVC80_8019g2 [Macleaya cordata]